MTCPKCKHQNTKLHDRYGKNRIERYKCIDCCKTFSANNHKPLSSMYVSRDKQNMILDLLVEGMSIRAISRLTRVDTKTILRLIEKAGEKCSIFLDRKMRELHCEHIQCDEIWTFVHAKHDSLPFCKIRKPEYGDAYVFVAIDANTKLVPFFEVGKRDMETTQKFIYQLRSRVISKFQLTTDGFGCYDKAITYAFKGKIDYAQVYKRYSGENVIEAKRRYSPVHLTDVLLKPIMGNPDLKKISTSYIERQNLNMRMNMRRFTRLTNGFSKKFDNLVCMLAIYYAHYNFIRIHGTLKTTPAVRARIADKVYTWDDMFAN